jgi:hypothetical protein
MRQSWLTEALGRTTVALLKPYVSAYFHSRPHWIYLGKSQARRWKKNRSAGALIWLNIDYT